MRKNYLIFFAYSFCIFSVNAKISEQLKNGATALNAAKAGLIKIVPALNDMKGQLLQGARDMDPKLQQVNGARGSIMGIRTMLTTQLNQDPRVQSLPQADKDRLNSMVLQGLTMLDALTKKDGSGVLDRLYNVLNGLKNSMQTSANQLPPQINSIQSYVNQAIGIIDEKKGVLQRNMPTRLDKLGTGLANLGL